MTIKASRNVAAIVLDNKSPVKCGFYCICKWWKGIKEYETIPKVKINVDDNESGPSGGLITALAIYNSLVETDITNNLTIVGTGTIEEDGSIGSIGGVEYKLKSAVRSNADLFIVPMDENYESAIKYKKENNYEIDIIGVSTFDEAVKYLENVNH